MSSLLPHQKLDWSISTLEDRLNQHADDVPARLELTRAVLSRALFHGGGEAECNRALALARKAMRDDPGAIEPIVLAGLALVGLDRPDAALKVLEPAQRAEPERADLRLALGHIDLARKDLAAALRHLEAACRAAPDAWETHHALGRALLSIAQHAGENRRALERAQFHLVRTLQLEPPPDQSAHLFRDMGLACMATGRFADAQKFFIRLREHDRHAPIARFHLGRVAYELGKYNNAIQHWRQYLRDKPDDPEVLARMAMAWFQLGEYGRARECCHQALMLEPGSRLARHALGCTLLEEGQVQEAIKVFREALKEHPDDMAAYVELARTRRAAGDVVWLVRALETEVGQYDRLPRGGEVDARRLTRERVRVILEELRAVGPSTVAPVLACIDRTQDEGLRFQLWEAATGLTVAAVADAAAARLREPGKHYGPRFGAEVLACAAALPEPVLRAGLVLDEGDLKRAAVERHPAAADVTVHRKNLEAERGKARAWQAMLLVALATRKTASSRDLLRQWGGAADADLAMAAWAGLAMLGDPDATRRLRDRGVSDGEQTRCSTCGRGTQDVAHLMSGSKAVVCDLCVGKIGTHRRTLKAPEDATCDLCSATQFEARGMFSYNGVAVCTGCLELSLGLLEREEVDRFLGSW
jgi:tetratricopeptide (TPR) repeat protein